MRYELFACDHAGRIGRFNPFAKVAILVHTGSYKVGNGVPSKGNQCASQRRSAYSVTLALAMALAGCEAASQPHVLVIADNVDPSSLNPLLAHDQETIGYDLLVTQTLVGLSAANRLVPVLVTRVPSRCKRRHLAGRQNDRLSSAP